MRQSAPATAALPDVVIDMFVPSLFTSGAHAETLLPLLVQGNVSSPPAQKNLRAQMGHGNVQGKTGRGVLQSVRAQTACEKTDQRLYPGKQRCREEPVQRVTVLLNVECTLSTGERSEEGKNT